MNKSILIPRLAIGGMRKNASSYVPYFLITIFSIFTFFIFSAICDNEIIMTLPKAIYVLVLMQIGRVLLAIILAPVLFATNKFLVKQRKNELGLYNVLGLDRRYIGLMMLIESVIIYIVTLALGILLGVSFSKLIFLLLLNMANLSVEANFTISLTSIAVTAIYFGIIVLFNLVYNLLQVLKAKPVELMKENKKGEKKVRFLRIKSFLGFAILLFGYYVAVHTEVDSMIFVNFFLDVFLVVIGTRLLFSAGSITILNRLKRTKSIYYKKNNFVTISGMLYRMKRNAQNLSNICIFSTMIMITLVCTVSLFMDKENAILFNYPLDVTYKFEVASELEDKGLVSQLEQLAQENEVILKDMHRMNYQSASLIHDGNTLRVLGEEDDPYETAYTVRFLSLDTYQLSEGGEDDLAADEVLFFSAQKDISEETVNIGSKPFKVKKKLQSFSFENKEDRNLPNKTFYVIFKDQNVIDEVVSQLGAPEALGKYMLLGCDLEGKESQKSKLINEMNTWCEKQEGFCGYEYLGEWEEMTDSMYGGLLFLGMFFGIVFTACMILMMYYKQLSEGYEDQRSFKIFKQVGMSDKEIREAIKSQILLVFFIPLLMAALHTLVALYPVSNLLAVICLFNRKLILLCALCVICIFAVIYVISYVLTSRAYYRIVK